MDTSITHYRVRRCSVCSNDAEYLCASCPCDLCPHCKVSHVQDLGTMDHRVVSFHETYLPVQEICLKHPDYLYIKICKFCDRTDCFHCKEDEKIYLHIMRNTTEYQKERTCVLIKSIKTDVKTCQNKLSYYHADMSTKAQRLKDLIGRVLSNFYFKHRCLNQKKQMKIYLSIAEIYEDTYEQSAVRLVQTLLYKKTACLPKIHLTLHTSQLSMKESLDKRSVMDTLTKIQVTEKGKRCIGKQNMLKLMPGPELHQSVALPSPRGCFHMTSVTTNLFWASYDDNNIILSNTAGDKLYHLLDTPSDLSGYGAHTVNSSHELIYIDKEYNIKKLSMDLRTTTTFLTRAQLKLRPQCIYWSLSTNELLVGMCQRYRKYIKLSEESEKFPEDTWTGVVIRFNETGQLTQKIFRGNTGSELFKYPCKITENNNGDVVVSDWSTAVVVTDREGRHRFSYTGHPPGSKLQPRGICTDALSHILVCDDETETVQLLDRDGQFLLHLLIRPPGIIRPHNLNYDVATHRLWVGSEDINKVLVYKYITRQEAVIEQYQTTTVMESPNGNPTQETETQQDGNECLLQLMSSPELQQSFTVKDVKSCYHISYFESDLLWVSESCNLVLTNTTGKTEHQLTDIPVDTFSGLHTVNSEGELFFIDKDYNIKKLSNDMNTITIFAKQTDDPEWTPRSVYWSSSGGDLLVGLGKANPETGKVSRYNRTGQQTQPRQHNNSDLEIYKDPKIITENTNGDIVVSDFDAVVVTERGGGHRFSYTGHPPGSPLKPRGICTDAMSHILVCENRSHTVHMLDENGQFLSYLLPKSQEVGAPSSLSYDTNTHRLWLAAGSHKKYKVFVYKYMTLKDPPNDEEEHPQFPEGFPLSG